MKNILFAALVIAPIAAADTYITYQKVTLSSWRPTWKAPGHSSRFLNRKDPGGNV